MATAAFIECHRVNNNSSAWRSLCKSLDALRQEHGCADDQVLVDPADPHKVFVLHRFPTVDQAEAFAGTNELGEAMSRAGFGGPLRIVIAT